MSRATRSIAAVEANLRGRKTRSATRSPVKTWVIRSAVIVTVSPGAVSRRACHLRAGALQRSGNAVNHRVLDHTVIQDDLDGAREANEQRRCGHLARPPDEGPGGVSDGNTWMMFDHDVMRVAGGWTGDGFIDWNAILLNDRHETYPRTIGKLHFETPVGPGWANPANGSFDDPRFTARDGRQFGPLPKEWADYKGLYHHGDNIDELTIFDNRLTHCNQCRLHNAPMSRFTQLRGGLCLHLFVKLFQFINPFQIKAAC